MMINKFLKVFTLPIAALYRFFISASLKCIAIFTVVSRYTYGASVILVISSIDSFRNMQERFKELYKNINARHLYRASIFLISTLAIIALLAVIILYCLFIVPVGSSAVITRFGKAVREVSSGLNIALPFVERYYIVNTGNLLEETFGFVQGPLPLTKTTLNPQEDFVINDYQSSILLSEADTDAPFSKKGSFIQEMNRKQRLTHDYIRKHYAPPRSLTARNIVSNIKQKADVISTNKQQFLNVEGKVPQLADMLLLTGDLGLINIQWTLQYHIQDPTAYLFRSRDVQLNIRDIAMASMNMAIGETTFIKILTTGRQDTEKRVITLTQALLDRFHVGIQISQVIILNVTPTPEVNLALLEINKATQDMEKYFLQGKINYMNRIPQAYGEARKIILFSKAYAIKIFNKAKGETARFNLVNNEYILAPKITKDRLYITTMENILSQTPNIIMDENTKGILPLFINSVNSQQKNNSNVQIMNDFINQLRQQATSNQLQPLQPQKTTPSSVTSTASNDQAQTIITNNSPAKLHVTP